jgi:lipopolysaccharide/colanic/teichoic acid biosynthesis glycosyltransferase
MLTDTQVLPGAQEFCPQGLRGRTAQGGRFGDGPCFQTPALTRLQRAYAPARRLAELAAAVALAVLALPVVALAALVVKATSRGPAFYAQTRLGRGGRPFSIYKLRTMIHNCESLTGPRWSMPGDPRVTRFGQFLRLTHLDELPQLFNVLRGDMSLIGPRPERPEFVRELERAIPGYLGRLLVRPGVTGLAQVQLDADSGVESVRRKLAYDLFYIHHMGPLMDLRVLGCTVLHVFGVPFRMLRALFLFPTREAIEAALETISASEPQTPHAWKAA